jgi:hypothetical protein
MTSIESTRRDKYVFCLFNFLLLAAGILAAAGATWFVLSANSFHTILQSVVSERSMNNLFLMQLKKPHDVHKTACTILAAGALMILISILGFWGAYREYKTCLNGYILILTIILLTGLIAVGFIAKYGNEEKEKLRDFLKFTIRQYYTADKKSSVVVTWDYIMSHNQCCGVDNFGDFNQTIWKQENKDKLFPEACCILEGDVLKFQPKHIGWKTDISESNSCFGTGCYNIILEEVLKFRTKAIKSGFGFMLFKFVLIILALNLFHSLLAGGRTHRLGPA